MKLGFVLKITNGGESEAPRSFNKDEVWARYATDARSAIKELTNYDGTEKIVYLVKFLGSLGYLLSVIKARPEGSGRPNDNTAAWIYVPANVDISSEETIGVLKTVEDAISEKKGTDFERLERLFSQEYETNDVLMSAVGTINSNENSSYAVRYYNEDFILSELIGKYIAQQEYGKYKGIILIDKSQNIAHSSIQKLDFEPRQICIYNPLSPIDGFTPCFLSQNQYRPFNKAIEIPAGTPVSIYWVKKGYAVVKKTFTAQGDSKCPDSAIINEMEYKLIIPKKLFYVIDNNGIPVQQYDVWINYQQMEGDSMEISETYYNQGLVISVRAKGFAEWRKGNIHPTLDRQLTIQLSKQVFHYEFSIPVYVDGKDTNNDAIVSVETHHRLKSSPIKGYVAYDGIQEGEGRINRLFIDERWISKLKYMAYGFASCVFILLMYAGCSALENYEFKLGWPPIKEIKHTPNSNWNTAVDDVDDINQTNTDSIDAISYLEKNGTWHKDSLDKYETTRGLFEDLNSFNIEALKSRKEGVLNGINKFSDIVDKLDEYLQEDKNPHKGKEKNGGNYNSSNDKGIDLNNYLNWLSEEHASIDIFSSSNSESHEHKSPISGRSVRDDRTKNTNPKPQNEQPKKGGSRGSVN